MPLYAKKYLYLKSNFIEFRENISFTVIKSKTTVAV